LSGQDFAELDLQILRPGLKLVQTERSRRRRIIQGGLNVGLGIPKLRPDIVDLRFAKRIDRPGLGARLDFGGTESGTTRFNFGRKSRFRVGTRRDRIFAGSNTGLFIRRTGGLNFAEGIGGARGRPRGDAPIDQSLFSGSAIKGFAELSRHASSALHANGILDTES
jgi:hypothetical protein